MALLSSNWNQSKQNNFDRIEVRTGDGVDIVLEGLAQAYRPALKFFEWCAAE